MRRLGCSTAAGSSGEGSLLVADQDFAVAKRLLSELEISSVTVLPALSQNGVIGNRERIARGLGRSSPHS